MITIYHVPNSRSQRIVWLMEEMHEPYRLENIGFPVPDSFRAINPLGCVPTIVDDDADEPITMFESIGILLYITGRRLVAGDEKATALAVGPRPSAEHYAAHLQMLHFGEADLTVPVGMLYNSGKHDAPDHPTIAWAAAQLERRLAYLDQYIADGREWVTGDRFTIADISIGYAFLLAEHAQLGLELPARVAAYWQRLQARPAYKRSLAAD